jgi:hypothetical protein
MIRIRKVKQNMGLGPNFQQCKIQLRYYVSKVGKRNYTGYLVNSLVWFKGTNLMSAGGLAT